ncbi:MAG: M16 family metallopeptidase, partial [Planctomycetota bacterium]
AGSKQVVTDATTGQIAAYHRKVIRAGSSVLAIYGNFDAESTARRVEKLFASMEEGNVSAPLVERRIVPLAGERHVLKTQKQVAGIMVAAPGMKLDDLDDRFAIDVLDTIISGWNLPAGWLHEELRGKRLVYVVHAYNFAGLAPGAFQVYALSQPDKADQVAEIIQRNLDKAASYSPTQEEIDNAVNSILTAELLENQSISSLAMSAALDELYGFGYDFRGQMEARYRRIIPADVIRVAKQYLGGPYVVAITTPAAE